MKKEYITVCPICGSTRLKSPDILKKSDFSLGTPFMIETAGSEYKCENCSYQGLCPEIFKDKVAKFQKDLKSK